MFLKLKHFVCLNVLIKATPLWWPNLRRQPIRFWYFWMGPIWRATISWKCTHKIHYVYEAAFPQINGKRTTLNDNCRVWILCVQLCPLLLLVVVVVIVLVIAVAAATACPNARPVDYSIFHWKHILTLYYRMYPMMRMQCGDIFVYNREIHTQIEYSRLDLLIDGIWVITMAASALQTINALSAIVYWYIKHRAWIKHEL